MLSQVVLPLFVLLQPVLWVLVLVVLPMVVLLHVMTGHVTLNC